MKGLGAWEGWAWPWPEMVVIWQELWGQEGEREFRKLWKLGATCLGVGSDYLYLLICEMGTVYAGEDRTQCVTQIVVWKCSEREKAVTCDTPSSGVGSIG